jgi:hypothetical protein
MDKPFVKGSPSYLTTGSTRVNTFEEVDKFYKGLSTSFWGAEV